MFLGVKSGLKKQLEKLKFFFWRFSKLRVAWLLYNTIQYNTKTNIIIMALTP